MFNGTFKIRFFIDIRWRCLNTLIPITSTICRNELHHERISQQVITQQARIFWANFAYFFAKFRQKNCEI